MYGPFGTWKGGREKAPAAFCRKAICASDALERWGDGEQTRSFCLVDDCVEGLCRLMVSEHTEPLNLGSEEMVSMNEVRRPLKACSPDRIAASRFGALAARAVAAVNCGRQPPD